MLNYFRYTGPTILDSHINADTFFTFVDVLPYLPRTVPYESAVEMQDPLNKPKSASYRSVIESANKWLIDHSEWFVTKCESIQIPFLEETSKNRCHELDPYAAIHHAQPNQRVYVLRALRMWIKRRDFTAFEAAHPGFGAPSDPVYGSTTGRRSLDCRYRAGIMKDPASGLPGPALAPPMAAVPPPASVASSGHAHCRHRHHHHPHSHSHRSHHHDHLEPPPFHDPHCLHTNTTG